MSTQRPKLKRRPAKAAVAARPRLPRARRVDLDDLSDRFFRHLVFNLRTGVLAITRDGRVAVMNEIAYRVLGLTPRAADIGRPFTEVLYDCPEMARVLQVAFESDDLPNRAEMRLRKTGKSVGYSLSLIHDDDGRQVGATVFFKDLTRVEQIEERERLRDRLAALGEMAAAIAHEVKNPLASIEVMAGLLRRQFAGQPETRETLDEIIHEAKMANAIVVEVLEFVRPIQLQLERVPVDKLLADAVAIAEGKITRGRITIETRIDPQVPALVADEHQLRQLFTNLLTNAFESMHGAGRVDIRASLVPAEEESALGGTPLPSRVVIEVRDSGPGISPDDFERIFNPFFTTKPQGTGLGLAIVRKVVDAHDGHIDAMSAPGRGTTFRVTLPALPAPAWGG
jgi:signal transduction histidine kinase